jgi:hypothetical protein
MPRSVYSVVGHDDSSGFNPINLIKRFTAGAIVMAMVLLGTATMASAAVTSVTFVPANFAHGATSTNTVNFTVAAAITGAGAGTNVVLTFGTGVVLPATGATIVAGTGFTGCTSAAVMTEVTASQVATLTMPTGCNLAIGAASLTIAGVTNPTAPATLTGFSVSTSADATAGTANVVYTATAPTAVTFTPGSSAGLDTSKWTVGFTTSAQGALSLAGGSTIVLAFPTTPGFTWTSSPTVAITGGTGATTCTATGGATTATTLTITLATTGCAIAASTAVTLTVASVVNPTPQTFANTAFSVSTTSTVSGGDTTVANPALNLSIGGALAAPTATVQASGLVSVSFTPDGVATTYVVTSNPGGFTCTVFNATAPTTTQSCTISGLTNGTSYTFTVTPSGGSTTSTMSAASAAVTPVAILTTPSATSLGASTDGTTTTDNAKVSFSTDGAATLYQLTSALSATTVTVTFTGSTPSLSGTFVAGSAPAVGFAITGATSNGTLIVATVNTTANTFTATASGGTGATSTWGVTTLGTASVKKAGPTCQLGSTSPVYTGTQSCELTGLTVSGTYLFNLTPSGGGTTALPVTSTSAYTAVTQYAPPTAVAGNAAATVSFTANGAAASYLVQAVSGSQFCTVSGTPAANSTQSCSVTGLSNGTAYNFTLAPSGGSDVSAKSAQSVTAVTPTGALATPTVVNAGSGSQTITFTADGSATTYTVNSTAGGFSCVVANTSTVPTGSQSCTVTGLTGNTAYQYKVTPTTNGAADGLGSTVSAASTAVTTLTAIATPTVASTSSTSVKVTFTADGTATNYLVKSFSGTSFTTAGPTCTVSSTTALSGSQNCTVTGLTAGTAYEFTVTPSGNSDTGVASALSVSITPGTGLATPTVAAAGSGKVLVTFVADGVASTYTVTSYIGSAYSVAGNTCVVANTTTAPTGTQSCTVSGLTNGSSYEFSVVPTGNSTASTSSALSAAVSVTNAMATPTVANAGSGKITVSFVADGVATLYTVNTASGSPSGSCSVVNTTTPPTGAQSCTVSGLTNGSSYTFTVTPSGNSTTSGVSLASASISVGTTPLAAPTVAFAASGAVKVTFQADGVASTYTVNSASTATGAVNASCVVANSTTPPTGAQSCTVTGLTNGDAYTFTVTPSGNLTTSLVSAASASILVAGSVAPNAPTGVTAVGGAGTIAITWVAPTNTGGSAITGYTIAAVSGNTTTSCGGAAATATTCKLTGLAAGTYAVTVSAVNANGTGVASAAASATVTAVVVTPPTPTFKVIKMVGHAVPGKTVVAVIIGAGFYAQPRITSNVGGVRIGVSGDTGTALIIHITTGANVRRGVHTLHITLANGSSASVNYVTR